MIGKEEQALTEWKPSKIGSSTAIAIQQAQSFNNIRLRDEEDIKQVLRYSMLLVGLRANNMPTNEEKFILINFIKSNFGNQTPEEIRIAFEMAVAGKFNTDIKSYENFSCEYFGRIMNAYLDFARQEIKNLPKPIEEMKEPPSNEYLKKQAIEIANDYATEENVNRLKNLKGLSSLYDNLELFEIINIPKEEKLELWKKYYNIADIEERKSECKRQLYIKFINSLVTFDCHIDSEGNIKPNEK